MPGEPVDPGILSILGFLGPSQDVPCEWSQWVLEYLVSGGYPGTISGCPMPGEPVDPGILSIPGFLRPSRDFPCE